MLDDPKGCFACGSRTLAASLSLRKEVAGGDGTWRVVADLATVSVCESCLPWVDGTMRVAGSGEGDAHGRLGFPFSGAARTLNDHHCNYCWAQLFTEGYAVDLIPTGRTMVRGARFRHTGEIRQQRICRYCYAWWRTTLRDPSAVRGTGYRRDEGEMGGWRTTVATDAVSVALLERDDFTLAETVAAIGRRHRRLALHDGPLLCPPAQEAVFVCAGRRDRAARFVAGLQPAVRARVVVVGRPDCMTDALDALRLGAGELAASPLTPQQIAGAMERMAQGGVPGERGPQTGLPILTAPAAAGGPVPAHLLHIQLAPGEETPRAVLILRRFIRGYDWVGEAPSGGLAAMVFCPAEDVEAVTARLQAVFGEKSRVRVTASSARPQPATVAA